jgi:hypothetical protein
MLDIENIRLAFATWFRASRELGLSIVQADAYTQGFSLAVRAAYRRG